MVLMLALTRVSELSRLEEEFDSERLDVWFALILAFVIVSELSMLDDELESERLEV